MIYTEYFVKGTQPTELCPLHPSATSHGPRGRMFGAGDSTQARSCR